MIDAARARPGSPRATGAPGAGVSGALKIARARPVVAAATLAVAAVAWWWTIGRTAGMDAGMGPGAIGAFSVTWAVMMAAMMLPSFAPTIAAYVSSAPRAGRARWALFTGGYLLVWAAAGLIAYGLLELLGPALGGWAAWPGGGRWLSGGLLALAAAYQLTPPKLATLTRCHRLTQGGRVVGAAPRGPASGGPAAALAAGLREGGWCLACSWALMGALLALGWMSVAWMALIAALVTLEKLSPNHQLARTLTATILAALAAGVLI